MEAIVVKVGRYLPDQSALDWELTKINMLLDERLEQDLSMDTTSHIRWRLHRTKVNSLRCGALAPVEYFHPNLYWISKS